MNYTEIRREIGRRLGDPDLKKYRGLVGQCFVSSMCQLLEDEENYNIEEISGLIQVTTEQLVFETSYAEISLRDDAIKLMNIYQETPYLVHSILTYYEITQPEYQRMSSERAFRPADGEIFWFRRENKIHFIKSSTAQFTGTVIQLQYLMNPDPTQWQDTTNLITDENLSRNFIYKVIGKTVENISSYPAFNTGSPVAPQAYKAGTA